MLTYDSRFIKLLKKNDLLDNTAVRSAIFEDETKLDYDEKHLRRIRKFVKYLATGIKLLEFHQQNIAAIVRFGDNKMIEGLRTCITKMNGKIRAKLQMFICAAADHGKITILRTLLSWCDPNEEKTNAILAIQRAASANKPQTMSVLRVEYDAPIAHLLYGEYSDRVSQLLNKWRAE